jgi:hypothetical protein
MNSLVWHEIEHKLTSSFVLYDVPGLLFLGTSAGAKLFAIDKAPEAFGAQECLHLFAPGDIVVAIQVLNVMIVFLRSHNDTERRNKATRGETERPESGCSGVSKC